MNKRKKIELDLFSDETDFKQVDEFEQQKIDEIFEKEVELNFPIFFKNKDETQYTWYKDSEKFEQITINKNDESFRGSILFGYNEQIFLLKGDLTLFFKTISKNQIQITQQEYDNVFEIIINGRTEFFSDDEKYKYIEKLPLTDNKIKHKWKPI